MIKNKAVRQARLNVVRTLDLLLACCCAFLPKFVRLLPLRARPPGRCQNSEPVIIGPYFFIAKSIIVRDGPDELCTS